MCACPLIGGSSHSHEPSNQRNSSLHRGILEWVLMSLTQLCRRFGKRLLGTRSNNQIHLDFFATVPSVSVYKILAFLRLLVVLSNTINTSLILAVLGQMLNNDPSTERCWPACPMWNLTPLRICELSTVCWLSGCASYAWLCPGWLLNALTAALGSVSHLRVMASV